MKRKALRKLGPWEQTHRPYSLRVTDDVRKRIEGLRKVMPLDSILRQGLGLLEREVKRTKTAIANAERAGWSRGYEAGTAKGRDEGRESSAYVLRVTCSSCGKHLDLDFMKEGAGKTYWKVVNEVIKPEGWRHTACPPNAVENPSG